MLSLAEVLILEGGFCELILYLKILFVSIKQPNV